MATLYRNFLAGTITDNPLMVGASSANSANFANLPNVGDPDIMWMVLDPDATAGEPELVKIITHVTSTTAVTIERGQQGTTEREHAQTTVWRIVATQTDLEEFLKVVTTADIEDDAVTSAKIGDQAVRPNNFSPTILSRAATQSIPNNTATDIVWDTETQDLDGWITVSTATLTAPATGAYVFAVEIDAAVALQTGAPPSMEIYSPSATVIAGGGFPVDNTNFLYQWGGVAYLRSGQTVKVKLTHTQGGAVNVTAKIVILRIA